MPCGSNSTLIGERVIARQPRRTFREVIGAPRAPAGRLDPYGPALQAGSEYISVVVCYSLAKRRGADLAAIGLLLN
jgi:hypothetical protein